jgi:hypothetical protein
MGRVLFEIAPVAATLKRGGSDFTGVEAEQEPQPWRCVSRFRYTLRRHPVPAR